MGNLADIIDLMKKAPRVAQTINQSNIQGKSLIRRAKDSTFQFPCIIPNTAPVDMATAITRMMDRVYAGYTQIALGNDPTMNMAIDHTPTQFLKRFHQNIKFEQAISDLAVPEDERELYMEKVYTGEYKLYSNPQHTQFVLFNTKNDGLAKMLQSNRELMKPYLEDVNIKIYQEAESDYTTPEDVTQAMLAGKMQNYRDQQIKNRVAISKEKRGPMLLTEGDAKKINDMTPYAVQIRLSVVNDENEFVQYMDCVVGIKTVLHLIDSEDMIVNLERALQNKSGLFRFLRWTTGEISFFKDLVLHMDDLRFDAANQNSGKTPFFGNLKRMKRRGIGISGLSMPHGLIPNATLVVTSYEVDYLKNKYGILLKDASIAKKLMEVLDLMTFIVCDDSTGTIEILYDGDAAFQTYALESIEREISLSSNKLGREIGRMIGTAN